MTAADELLADYLAAKRVYVGAQARTADALRVEEAAGLSLLAARKACVDGGVDLASLPPAQPEIETPPTVGANGKLLPGHPGYQGKAG